MTRRREIEDAKERIATEGAGVAVEALIAVCRDTKAPAPARATAGTSLLRAAGLFDRTTRDDDSKEPSEMTGEELRRKIEWLQAQTEAGAIPLSEDGEEDEMEDEDADRACEIQE